jgi:6-pyruvoyltetrahydropterin/6-carboxytetrahydropterin synthase
MEPLHGHDWKVEAVFRGQNLDSIGVLVDFQQASAALHAVLGELDYSDLSAVSGGVNPTAEWVAKWIFDRLRARMGQQAPLAAVYIEEAPGCVAGYAADS